MAETINKDMLITEVLAIDPLMRVILEKAGMHCLDCPSSVGETLEEAALVHGIDIELLVGQINDFLTF